ncbi:MAG: hypothetical protein HQK56_12105 [Deltaproteobacteria bacterium]|nr:hypothetical protein [Deltaproteobacteria bacterium]
MEKWITGQQLLDHWNIPFFKFIEFVNGGLRHYDPYSGRLILEHGVFVNITRYNLEEMSDLIRKRHPDLEDEAVEQKAREIINLPSDEINTCDLKYITTYPTEPFVLRSSICPDLEEDREEFIKCHQSFLFSPTEVNEVARTHGLPLILEQHELDPPQSEPDYEAKTETTSSETTPTVPHFVFRLRNDDRWEIGHPDRPEPFEHLVGFVYITHLLAHPNEKINCTELYRLTHPLPDGECEIMEQPLERTDKQAVDAVLKKLSGLKEDKEDLLDRLSPTNFDGVEDRDNLENELETVEQKIKKCEEYLAQTTFQGKPKLDTQIDSQRRGIGKAISTTFKKIHKALPEIIPYLSKDLIRTGSQCEYIPSPTHPVKWKLS